MRKRGGMSTFKAGLIGVIVLIIVGYGALTKFANPFSSPYTIHAIFSNANQLSPSRWCGSPGSTSAR